MAKDNPDDPVVYECHNPACTLGTAGAPGRFTSGATAQYVSMLKGAPEDTLEEGTHYGEGVCPNCGEKGEVI